jgi:hypothetical protein
MFLSKKEQYDTKIEVGSKYNSIAENSRKQNSKVKRGREKSKNEDQ